MSLTNPPPLENTPPPRLSISNLVTAVRDELERVEAERKVKGRQPLFQLSKMEINVQFVATVNETIKGGFDLQVVAVGGEREATTEKTQSVTLTYDVMQGITGRLGIYAAMPPDPNQPHKGDHTF